jgi:tape measure domain-containing protein
MAKKVNISTDEAVAEIRKLVTELKTLDKNLKSISKGSVASFNKLANSMTGFKSKITELNASITRLSNITKTNSTRLTRNSNELKRNSDLTKTASKNTRAQTNALNKNTQALNKGTTATTRNTQATSKGSSAIGAMAVKFAVATIAFLGLQNAVTKGLKSIVDLTIKFQSLGYALDKITGGNFAEIKRSWEFLIKLNDKFGAKLSTTADRWLKFRAAARASNMSLVDTMQIFKSVTKASAVLGLSTDELKGVYLALEQMLSKGKVTTEELRRQLGERLPGAMGIMAKAVGVSVSQLDKMLKKGEVLSSVALPKFAKALEEAYGIEALETVDNLATGVGKLGGAWDRLVLTISEGDSIITNVIGGFLWLITSALNGLSRLTESYDQTSNRISGAKYGDEVRKQLSDEIEARLRLNKSITTTEEELKKQLATEKKLASATVDGSEERVKAVKKVMEAGKELADFQKKKAEEGNLLAIAEYDNAKKELDRIQKLRDEAVEEYKINKPITSSDDPIAVRTQAYAKYSDKLIEAKRNLQEQNDAYTRQLEYVKQLNELLTPTGGENFIDLDEDGSGRKIKYAEEWINTNQLLIRELKERIRLNEELAKDEPGDIMGRIDMAFENAENLKRITDLEYEDKKKANDLWLEQENQKLEENLTSHIKNGVNLAEQQKENEKQRLANQREYQEKSELLDQEYRHQLQENLEHGEDEWEDLIEDRFSFAKRNYDKEEAEQLQRLQKELQVIGKGGNEEKRIMLEIAQLEVKYFNQSIDMEVEKLRRTLRLTVALKERKRLLTEIAILEAQKKEDPANNSENVNSADGSGGSTIDPVFASKFSTMASMSQDFTNEMFGFADQILQNRIDKIDAEIAAEEKKYDRLLELAKNDEEEKKIIERNREIRIKQLEEKKRKEQIKQAKLNKSLAITQAITSIALGVVNALATSGPPWVGIAMAALVGAAGALQLASIIATPIPTFAKGGEMKNDGKALINDGGAQEYVERGGKILTTTKENAIVNLKKGDIIHKDFETLQKKTMLLNLFSGGQSVSQKELNLALGIKEEIKEGFKKVQVNSKVTVLNEINNYREKMSMWN